MTRKLIAFAILMIPIAAYTDYHYQKSRLSSAPQVSEAKYGAGTCVRELYGESWDATWRIEMVGERNYLIRRIPENLWKDSIGSTMPFDFVESYMRKVKCPSPGS